MMLASDLVLKHGKNLLKTGVLVVLSTLASSSVREACNVSMNDIVQDIRRIRREAQERKSLTT